MSSELFNLLQKPALWQRSAEPFWDDEHISKGMLKAHIDPDSDAASRRAATVDKSVNWISSLISPNSKILDLGCGPGLYCKRFSGLGFDVTGIDFSRRSIDYAKENDGKTKYFYQNYLEMTYADCFDAIIMIYCDFAALTFSERQLLLSKVYSALKPGGLFIFDVFTDLHFKDQPARNEWTVNQRGGFWSAEPYIHLEATHYYADNTVSVSQNIILTEKETKEYLIWDTVYNSKRLADEITPSGFSVAGEYGDVCGSSLTDNSQTLCFVVKKQESPAPRHPTF